MQINRLPRRVSHVRNLSLIIVKLPLEVWFLENQSGRIGKSYKGKGIYYPRSANHRWSQRESIQKMAVSLPEPLSWRSSFIAQQLPGRSADSIRVHYSRIKAMVEEFSSEDVRRNFGIWVNWRTRNWLCLLRRMRRVGGNVLGIRWRKRMLDVEIEPSNWDWANKFMCSWIFLVEWYIEGLNILSSLESSVF